MISAILWDYDGVIVDSMPYHAQAWKKMLADYGLEVEEEEIYEQEGRPTPDVVQVLFARRNRPVTPEQALQIAREKERRYLSAKDAQPFPEAMALIGELRQRGVPMALVTGSPLRSVRAVLADDQLALFSTVVTADDVKNGKPAPDPYLKAAQKLQKDPRECLVVENAPLGIAAAQAAGMRVAAIATTLPPQRLRHADFVAENFAALREFLFEQLNDFGKLAVNA